MSSSEATALPTFPDRSDLCDGFLDRDVGKGRAGEVVLLCAAESGAFALLFGVKRGNVYPDDFGVSLDPRAELRRSRARLDLSPQTQVMGPWTSPGGAR